MYKHIITLEKPVTAVFPDMGELFFEDSFSREEAEENEDLDRYADSAEHENAKVVEQSFQHNELLEEQNELLAQIKNLLQGMHESIVHHLVEEKNSLEQIFEKIPALAFQIAEKIIHKKIFSDPTIIIENLKRSIDMTANAKKLRISMNPNDIHIVRNAIAEFGLDEKTFNENWELEANKDILPGGCLVKTENEEIDARIESQLQALEDSILNYKGN